MRVLRHTPHPLWHTLNTICEVIFNFCFDLSFPSLLWHVVALLFHSFSRHLFFYHPQNVFCPFLLTQFLSWNHFSCSAHLTSSRRNRKIFFRFFICCLYIFAPTLEPYIFISIFCAPPVSIRNVLSSTINAGKVVYIYVKRIYFAFLLLWIKWPAVLRAV